MKIYYLFSNERAVYISTQIPYPHVERFCEPGWSFFSGTEEGKDQEARGGFEVSF
jgi:hypothetical protein